MQKGFLDQLGDFDGDEFFLLFFSGAICFKSCQLFWNRMSASSLGSSRFHRLPIFAATLTSFILLLIATRYWAAREVRANGAYILLGIVMGGAYGAISAALISWMGISLRDDALERRNFPAMLAFSAALPGAMLIYIGSNLGEGPSFWNNVFCSALGLITWGIRWLWLELSSGISRSVIEDRDLAAAWRLSGFLIADGLILGRALAGDWHSVGATVQDFVRDGWPAFGVLIIAALIEPLLKPSAKRPLPSWKTCGVPTAVAYVLIAILWVLHVGWWEGAPR